MVDMDMNKILIFGDSIAYGKWDEDGGWVSRLRKFIDQEYNIGKGGNVQVYNMGIPGEVTVRMVNRVQKELEFRITDPKEKVAVIFAIGVNDSCPNNWMTNQQTSPDDFKESLSSMIQMAKDKNCQILVLGLAPVDPTKSKGLQFTNEKVKEFDGFINEVCNKLEVTKIDVFESLMSAGYQDLLVDSVHPNSKGHEMIFQKVSSLFID